MTGFRILLAAAATLFASACLPVSTLHPIGTTAGFKPDPALYGTWRGADSDRNIVYFHFLANADGTLTAVLVEPPHDKDGGSVTPYALTTAALGSNHFINAREIGDNGKPAAKDEAKVLFPLLYRMTGRNMLTLSLLDEKRTADAIKAGKIKGVVDPGENGDVHITAEPALLDAFFAGRDGSGLFGKPLIVLHRLN